MEYTLEKNGSSCGIRFTGALGVSHAAEAKEALLPLMSSFDRVAVSLKSLQDLDLSTVQLFCAANMSFEKTGKVLFMDDTDPETLSALLTEVGYGGLSGCVEQPCKKCFWKGDAE